MIGGCEKFCLVMKINRLNNAIRQKKISSGMLTKIVPIGFCQSQNLTLFLN
jgi:hypothetical protein